MNSLADSSIPNFPFRWAEEEAARHEMYVGCYGRVTRIHHRRPLENYATSIFREEKAAREVELANEMSRLAKKRLSMATNDVIADWEAQIKASAEVATVRINEKANRAIL